MRRASLLKICRRPIPGKADTCMNRVKQCVRPELPSLTGRQETCRPTDMNRGQIVHAASQRGRLEPDPEPEKLSINWYLLDISRHLYMFVVCFVYLLYLIKFFASLKGL